MPFVTQKFRNDCGAFCLCYFEWLKANRLPTQILTADQVKKDYERVDDVYAAVQFGDGLPDLPMPWGVPADYCDPVRMILLLRIRYPQVSFYIDPESVMFPVYEAMKTKGTREYAFIEALESLGDLHQESPPPPGPEKAVIAIYNMISPRKELEGQHYILFQECNGALSCFNPWDGEAVPCKEEYADFQVTMQDGVHTLSPAKAAIVIS